ncbi:PAAR domain-containing protein [Caballeronia sp.]|uniref:PAAR domain-containing protein n=1 Tax=Caballeronia sp. TaxID=1931223 RepID=UPI003C3A9233
MRIPIVRHGDPTTTDGKVVAFSATIHDDGRKFALFGDQATCGNCKGLWNIVGTGEGTGENGRVVVINGDRVLCPCGKNRVIAGADAGMFVHIDIGARRSAANAVPLTKTGNHWITFSLNEPGSCEGLRCVATFTDGTEETGLFDANNKVRFERADNDSTCSHVALSQVGGAGASGSITESLLSAIAR